MYHMVVEQYGFWNEVRVHSIPLIWLFVLYSICSKLKVNKCLNMFMHYVTYMYFFKNAFEIYSFFCSMDGE